jgi:hypothetical protein
MMNRLAGLWRRRHGVSDFPTIHRLYVAAGASDSAEACGRRLLRHWLSAEQRAQFDVQGYFETVGCATGKRYRIYYAPCQNVREVDEAGNVGIGWCFAPAGGLVPGDVMLAQKIALETNELAALAVANRFAPGSNPMRELRRAF